MELGVGESAGVLLEDADELVADRLALLLRLDDAMQSIEEAVGRIDVDQLDAHVATERLRHLGALAESHQPGVDVDAGQPMTNRPMDEGGGDGRVDATGQSTDRPPVSNLFLDPGDLLVGHRRHRPRLLASGALDEEATQYRHPVRRVDDFGMELHAVDAPPVVLQHDNRSVVRRRRGAEPRRRRRDRVEVAHPHVVDVRRLIRQHERLGRASQRRAPVLAAHSPSDLTSELEGDQLRSVADPEDRHPEVVDRRIETG